MKRMIVFVVFLLSAARLAYGQEARVVGPNTGCPNEKTISAEIYQDKVFISYVQAGTAFGIGQSDLSLKEWRHTLFSLADFRKLVGEPKLQEISQTKLGVLDDKEIFLLVNALGVVGRSTVMGGLYLLKVEDKGNHAAISLFSTLFKSRSESTDGVPLLIDMRLKGGGFYITFTKIFSTQKATISYLKSRDGKRFSGIEIEKSGKFLFSSTLALVTDSLHLFWIEDDSSGGPHQTIRRAIFSLEDEVVSPEGGIPEEEIVRYTNFSGFIDPQRKVFVSSGLSIKIGEEIIHLVFTSRGEDDHADVFYMRYDKAWSDPEIVNQDGLPNSNSFMPTVGIKGEDIFVQFLDEREKKNNYKPFIASRSEGTWTDVPIFSPAVDISNLCGDLVPFGRHNGFLSLPDRKIFVWSDGKDIRLSEF